jgi:hypothetical protein
MHRAMPAGILPIFLLHLPLAFQQKFLVHVQPPNYASDFLAVCLPWNSVCRPDSNGMHICDYPDWSIHPPFALANT